MKVEDLIQHYRAVRKRLTNPPNAVQDRRIDLTRKSTAYRGDTPPPGTPPKKVLPSPPKVKLYKEIQFPINFNDVIDGVSEFYEIPVRDIKGSCRFRELVNARKMVVHLALKLIVTRTLSSIARGLDKDHTTIIHARKKALEALEYDPAFKSHADGIEEAILAKHRDRLAAAIDQPDLEIGAGEGSTLPGVPAMDCSGGGSLAPAEALQFDKID